MKTKFSNGTLQKVCDEYNLGILKKVMPCSEGVVQTNIILETNKNKFVFRYYENRSQEYIKFEVNILHYFNNHKYPCAMPIKNIHGEFLGIHNKKFYTLFKHIKGKHIKKPNSKQFETMVKYLARLHNISKQYKPKYFDFRESHDINYCLKTCKEEIKNFKSKLIGKERMQIVKSQIKTLQFPNSIPRGVCHCDYDISNIHFIGNNISGVFDFDDACYTYLIYDVATLVYYWAWIREKNGKLDFNKTKKLIRIYIKYRKLSKIEKLHLFDSLKMINLTYMAWFFADTKQGYFDKSVQRLKELDKIGRENFYMSLFE